MMENGFAHTDLEEYDLVFDRHYHGRNIKLSEDGLSAQKIKKGAKEALVVTNRPLASNELFEVEVGAGSGFKGVKHEVKHMLKGKESIRIGVTVHCPSDVVSLSTQHSMKRMDSGTWMMMAEQVVDSGEATMSLQKYSLKELNIGDRVGIIRLPEFLGSLVIYINGAPIGIIATRVSDNVYGFVEMQGDCEKICISSNRTIKEEALPLEIRAMRECQVQLKDLKKELEKKEENVQMLEGQLELLRKQVIRMKSSSSQLNVNHSSSKLDTMQDSETQTTPTAMANGRHASRSPSSGGHGSTKQACCNIL